MKTDHRRTFELPLALMLALSACGGTTPAPSAPAEAPRAATDAGVTEATSTAAFPQDPPKSDTAAPAMPSPEPKSTASNDSIEKPTRPVRNILEATDTVFFLSFEESDPGKAAEASCTKESGGDPEKNSACMAKARQTMEGKGYRFKRNPKDETTCSILRRQGNTLSLLHKFRFKYGEETENSAIIKLEGADQGPIKWEKIPLEFKVEVPSDYMIVMQDPKHGRLVYYAKVGIPGD